MEESALDQAPLWDDIESFDGDPWCGKVDLVTKENDADRAVVAGDLVSFWIEKGKYYTYRDALVDAGKADCGHVMKWWREADKPKKNPALRAPHTYGAKIRPPEAKDGDLADRCEAAYHEQAKRPALDAAPSADPFPPKYDAAEGF